MNQTAKKLREEADYMSGVAVSAAETITMARNIFDIEPTDTFGGDLGRVLVVIADELDELQARAAEANNLQQRLKSAEDKAERRKQHIEYLNTAIRDKNGLLEQRGGTIARLTAENGKLRKQAPSDRERQILDMWPRFEDGEPVWYGDEVDTMRSSVIAVEFFDGSITLSSDFDHLHLSFGERVKRPAPKVLDADGVEIKVGDTVYGIGRTKHRFEVIDPHHIDPEVGEAFSVRCYDRDEHEECHCKPKLLTHTCPDSWERLEEDAESIRQIIACNFGDFSPSDFKQSGDSLQDRVIDIIRRAKALAGVEVD